MKMVKSLLLGSAAGLVAVAGAQAADLPVKAKPVQYVKICSLYGVGFYYIPGTDMCIKIGGWVRAEYGWGQNGNFAWGWANGNVNNRTTNNSDFRARGYITADARDQTEYGTVRGYIAIGLSENEHGGDVNASTAFSANRAFIQWAGFTFGRAQSFFDFYSNPATSYWGAFPGSDTGDGGWFVMGYTAQFGNGFSGTIAAEAPRKTNILNTGTTGGILLPVPGTVNLVSGAFVSQGLNAGYGGFQAPDVVANLRVDQAWGSAQIMGALHEVNTTYYNSVAPTATAAGFVGNAAGHPDDKLGWAAGFGFKLNTPWLLNWLGSGQGDYIQTQFNYAQGALRYLMQTTNSSWGFVEGNSQSLAIMTDAVYGGVLSATGVPTATSLQLTTGWNVNAAYEHFWSPRWRTSLYGGYAAVSYGSTANNLLCSFSGAGAGVGGLALAGLSCDNNWNTWWLGSRTQWNITKDFYMGVDVLYQKLNSGSMTAAGTLLPAAALANTIAPVAVADPDNWSFRFRVHRDFYP
jgi:Porin subfamily